MSENFSKDRSLKDDFKTLLTSPVFADIDINVNGVTIKAHKCILASRNEVFRIMLLNDTAESESNLIEISNVDLKTFQVFSKFLYTEEILEEDITTKLLLFANQYLQYNLKKICEYSLSEKINYGNAVERLLAAIYCNCNELKRFTSNFIARHFNEMENMTEFQVLYTNKEIVRSIFKALQRLYSDSLFVYTFQVTIRNDEINSNTNYTYHKVNSLYIGKHGFSLTIWYNCENINFNLTQMATNDIYFLEFNCSIKILSYDEKVDSLKTSEDFCSNIKTLINKNFPPINTVLIERNYNAFVLDGFMSIQLNIEIKKDMLLDVLEHSLRIPKPEVS